MAFGKWMIGLVALLGLIVWACEATGSRQFVGLYIFVGGLLYTSYCPLGDV